MRRLAALATVLLLISLAAKSWAGASSGTPDSPDWSAPAAMAIKRVSDASSIQDQSNTFGNLDCTPTDYRVSGSSAMQTGCFTSTALGDIDSDNDAVIFNGTDEAVPLLPYSAHQVLVPWPAAGDLIALDASLVSGSYISLYTNPLGVFRDQRNLVGEVTAKQLTAAPNLQLRSPDGQPLVINPQTLAFSDGGSWLVAEDVNGSFVRINLATLDMIPFAPSIAIAGDPGLLRSQVAISPDGNYVAINNEAAGSFKVYDLTSCAGQTVTNLTPLNCKAYDYRYFAAQQISGLQSIQHVRFVNDGLISFAATAGTPASNGTYELAPAGSISSLIDYLALGDSFTSGEGAFDYLAGTDTVDDACHLSANSYPLLLTRDLFSAQGGHSVACSGAEINDVGDMSNSYRGQVKGVANWQQLQQNTNLVASVMANFLPGYVAQRRFVQQWQPGMVTVSVGGDDIGFGDILQECVEPEISLHASADTCFGTYEERLELENLIDRTVPRWVKLYQGLLAAAPGARLYTIGYPQIVSDTGTCALNVHLSQGELEFTEEIVDYLNGDIRQAAAKAGVPYVDISQALAGHRLCEAASYDVAVNGLTAGKDAGILGIDFLGKESYHPNALGQQLIEQAVLKQTHNFAEAPTANSTPPNGSQLLSAPKSGGTVYVRVPEQVLTSAQAGSGQAITINASGNKDGLESNSNYTVHVDGPNGPTIGTLSSDGSGDIDGSVTIPASTEPGDHTIDVTGTNQAGQPVDVTQPVYTPAGSGDSDGDGIPDSSDSCPYTVNSGVDSDHDGIDDACDPIIGPPPGPGTTSSGGSADSGSSPIINNSDGDSSDGGISLGDESVTVAGSIPTVASETTAQALGSATANPTKLTAKSFRTLGLGKHLESRPFFLKLRSLDWLPWLVLPAIAWLLLLIICLALKWFEKSENKYLNRELSTTIS